ncbi:MAG: DNA gyrase subunit A [Halanaerobiales bacterium]
MTNITPITIEEKMKDSYLNYSLSVIVGRALPDVRDGLKPVHRRILYAARELGLTSGKPHKKSARIVGEVLGKYHPHGDAAVYDAMVRMAQHFNQRYQLIDGHGNFGSIDGDSPAAMRYTEARLTPFSEKMLKDIKLDTVDFIENFDGTLEEPEVLPSSIPNLLVNGSSGIAVGMSTSIPPHNLKEVINALKYLIKHPGAKIETLIDNYISGPDFPTGAQIIGTKGLKKAYKTGKGKVTLRGKSKISKSGRKIQIIITELPYQVNKAKLIENIADLVNQDKISNVTDIRDETDKEGMRIVLELKQNAEPQIVLNRLYKYTKLQKNYRINLLALVNNRPEVMNLTTILNHFITFRKNVITRRTKHKLKNTEERYHIVMGLIKAVSELDLVISIIRNSRSTETARDSLQKKLKITERQAEAILQMQLRRLVVMEINKLKEEKAELESKINYYQKILNNEKELDKVLIEELNQIKKEFGDKRKTTIIENEEKAEISKKDLIKEKKAVVSYSYRQNLKRTNSRKNIRSSKKDYIIEICSGLSLDHLLFFNQKGQVYSLPIHDIPEHHGLSTGDSLSKFLKIPLNENIVKVLCLNEEIKNKYINIATIEGIVKKSLGKEYETTYSKIKAIKLNQNDEVVDASVSNGNKEVFLATQKGRTIRFNEKEINATGRNTIGSKGITLEDQDQLINMNIINDEEYIVSISKNGTANKISIKDFKSQNRNGKGYKISSADSYEMIGIFPVKSEQKILLITTEDKFKIVNENEISLTQRPGYMYKLFELDNDEKIKEALPLPLIPETKKDN